MLPFKGLYSADCSQFTDRYAKGFTVDLILPDIITKICTKSFDIEFGLLNSIVADDQFL
ncbi:hypothetical protein D3C71_1841620 [compost metagenome]